jgi:parallel beta-helix repeat protein
MALSLTSGATLKAITNSASNYSVVGLVGCSNVTITGGTITGDRSTHTGTTGEWGMGIYVGTNSTNITIQDLTVNECWGDGIYVAGSGCANVIINGVVCDHNRRQGLSIIWVDGMVVKNSTFKNTQGTGPECGIDFEPNENQSINNVQVSGCTITNNSGGGIQAGGGTTTRITNIVIDSNTISGNAFGARSTYDSTYGSGILLSQTLGATALGEGVTISNNQVVGNNAQGICVYANAAYTVVKGNTVTGTVALGGNSRTGGGIYIDASPHTSVTGNTVTGNAGTGIWLMRADSTVSISGNTVSGNAKTHWWKTWFR